MCPPRREYLESPRAKGSRAIGPVETAWIRKQPLGPQENPPKEVVVLERERAETTAKATREATRWSVGGGAKRRRALCRAVRYGGRGADARTRLVEWRKEHELPARREPWASWDWPKEPTPVESNYLNHPSQGQLVGPFTVEWKTTEPDLLIRLEAQKKELEETPRASRQLVNYKLRPYPSAKGKRRIKQLWAKVLEKEATFEARRTEAGGDTFETYKYTKVVKAAKAEHNVWKEKYFDWRWDQITLIDLVKEWREKWTKEWRHQGVRQ